MFPYTVEYFIYRVIFFDVERERQREAAAFFSALLNAPSIDQLTESEWRVRAQELRSLLQSVVQVRQLSPEPADQTWNYLLQETRSLAKKIILRLLEGRPASVDRQHLPRLTFRLHGRSVEEVSEVSTTEDGLYALLLRIIRQDPFPFGQCPICRTVFVQLGKGKPRRYCTESCRTKGVPSAVKKTEYMRGYRQKHREREIEKVKRTIRAFPNGIEEQLAQLEKTFPRKSRRQRLYLLKQAQRKRKEATHGRVS